MQLDRGLDLAQPPHPRERSAESGELRARVGPEVPQPLAQRLACEWVAAHVLVQRLAFPPLAWRLRARHALPHDRLALTPVHDASLPAA